MRPLSNTDIESELSYAYLHAVAAHARAGCHTANRASDGNGIDATLTSWGPFPDGGVLEEVDLKVQLKATSAEPIVKDGHISYFLKGVNRFDDLRSNVLAVHRILVVMFLPANTDEWLTISDDELSMKKCAYWVSLRGAAATTNERGATIYIPQAQIFNTPNLMGIFGKLSRMEVINYGAP